MNRLATRNYTELVRKTESEFHKLNSNFVAFVSRYVTVTALPSLFVKYGAGTF